jgi:hypothetical protein
MWFWDKADSVTAHLLPYKKHAAFIQKTCKKHKEIHAWDTFARNNQKNSEITVLKRFL